MTNDLQYQGLLTKRNELRKKAVDAMQAVIDAEVFIQGCDINTLDGAKNRLEAQNALPELNRSARRAQEKVNEVSLMITARRTFLNSKDRARSH